jgi:hypothetical protein
MDWLHLINFGEAGVVSEMSGGEAALYLAMVVAVIALTITVVFSLFSSRSLAHHIVCRVGELTLRGIIALRNFGCALSR